MHREGSPRTSDLAQRQCVPCKGGVPPLTPLQIQPLLAQLEGWQVVENHHLEKTYTTADFASGLSLVNRIGAIAEEQNHHPDLFLTWGRVVVRIWTHKIKGLSESDFILAARCDATTAEFAP
ncbi:MAG: 4a-hydroxytetrahydrobiopterin dehydratase [Acidobacteriota bacterium]